MFREAETQVSPVTMSHPSPRTAVPPCLPLDIKDSLKEDTRVLLWGFLLWAFALAFVFWVGFFFYFWLFEGEGFLDEGKLLKGDC
jgi:hypothetical protein